LNLLEVQGFFFSVCIIRPHPFPLLPGKGCGLFEAEN